MEEGFRLWANPSSPHAEGRMARSLLEEARERIKAALRWDGELIFTSGASEAAALALGGARGGRRFISAIEHDCIVQAAPDALVLPIAGDGKLDIAALEAALSTNPSAVVAVQSVNSETGGRQDLPAICQAAERAGAVLISDASQSAGKYGERYGASMVIVSAHKFGGPIGVGALLVRDFAMLAPSGGHERGYRRGTENLPGVLGMAAALDAAGEAPLSPAVVDAVSHLADTVRTAGGHWLSDSLAASSGFIHAIAMPRLSAAAQVMRFDIAGVAVSQGSACSSGSMRSSRVLAAMGVDRELAERTIRVSFGWTTTPQEIDTFREIWLELAQAAS